MPAATLELLKALVAIDSVNPSLVAGGAGEREIAAFIAAAGIPTILFGPSGEGAHAAEGWVSASATDAVADILVAVAEQMCG